MIRLITGRAGVGKTASIQREIVQQLKEEPLGAPIIVIVPDQLSYSMEYELTTHNELGGLVRAEVLTFKRLAWRVLQQEGGIARQELDAYGYAMLMRSILEDERQQLQLFRKVADRQGFIDQMTRMMQEFERYCIEAPMLTTVVEQLKERRVNPTYIQKLEDLQLIMERLERHIGTTYVDSERYLRLLREAISQSDYVKKATIYIDGFETFTTRELQIIEQLFLHSEGVTCTVQVDLEDEYNPTFMNGRLMYDALTLLLERHQLPLDADIRLIENKRTTVPALRHLERHIHNVNAPKSDTSEGIRLIEAEDRQAEIDAVARTIVTATQRGMRYRDIVIVYRQSEQYDDMLRRRLQQYDIPYFISTKKPMLHHPLIELTRSILEVIQSNWAYEPVMRALKTELFYPLGEREQWRAYGEQFENFVLMKGIVGNRWQDEERWTYRRYRGLDSIREGQTDEEIEKQRIVHAVRDRLEGPIRTLERRLQESKTGKAIATALFETIEQLNVYESLLELQKEEVERGELEKSKEHEQAWNKWVHVLEQFVMMFGDRTLSLREAIKILDEGLESLTFSQIPPSVDQVTITTFENASMSNPKMTFVIGLNDGIVPARIDFEGLLSDRERELFESLGFSLAMSTTEQLEREAYYVYRAFASPTTELVLSYALADEDEQALLPSLYIEQICEQFPTLQRERVVNDCTDVRVEESESYVMTPRSALTYVIQQWRHAHQQLSHMPPFWQATYDVLKEDPFIKIVLDHIMERTVERNRSARLPFALTRALYGTTIQSSVSRIESYYRCPFQHFVAHGLQLRERTQFTLEPPQLGELFHAALRHIHERLVAEQLTWRDVDAAMSERLAHETLQQLAPHFVHTILLSSSRYAYIQRKLTKIIQSTVQTIGQQARQSHFHPLQVEVSFGRGQPLPPIVIDLVNGVQMELRGQIDRIDQYTSEEGTYLRIVDYKSSHQQLDLTSVYYGLSLQMLTYLEAALQSAPHWLKTEAKPAGMLYFHVHDPMITMRENDDERLRKERFARYQMDGYVLHDVEIVQKMDAAIKGRSSVIPVTLKQDGDFGKAAKVLTEDEMTLLMQHTHERHRLAGNGIVAGDTRVYPYEYERQMPCTYCQYRAVCQYDESDPLYEKRQLETLSGEEALKKIEEERT